MFVCTTQGQVFQLTNPSRKPHPTVAPAKRGEIVNFSQASRRRLLDFLSRMDNSYRRATFVTLTFHYEVTAEFARIALKRFEQYVRYWFPEASGVWRIEQQGRGVWHFHWILFNLPYWPQYDLQTVWTECTEEDMSIAHITLIRTFGRYMYYISKYVAKVDTSAATPSLVVPSYQQNPSPASIGRVWGYMNKKALPLAPCVTVYITDDQMGEYAMWAISAESRGRANKGGYTRKAFTPDAGAMFYFLITHAGKVFYDLWEAHRGEWNNSSFRREMHFPPLQIDSGSMSHVA